MLLQVGHDPLAQQVAVVTQLGVAGVFHPAQALLLSVGANRRARHIQERPHQPARREGCQQTDAGKAGGTAAAHQVQEKGLGLVLRMVRGEEHFLGLQQPGDHPVAGVARGFFEAAARVGDDLEMLAEKRNVAFQAECAAVFQPLVRRIVQAVVEVNGLQRRREVVTGFVKRLQQGGGVGAAAETHPVPPRTRQAGETLEQTLRAEPLSPGIHGRIPSVLERSVGQQALIASIEQRVGFQRAEFLLEKGFIDRIIPRMEMRDELATLRTELVAPSEIDEESKERLAALGYLSTTAATGDGGCRVYNVDKQIGRNTLQRAVWDADPGDQPVDGLFVCGVEQAVASRSGKLVGPPGFIGIDQRQDAVVQQRGPAVRQSRREDDLLGTEVVDRAAAAEKIVAENEPGVLSDVVMPKLSGPELLRRISSSCPNAEFVLMSGYPLDEHPDLLEIQLATNVRGPYLCSQAAARMMAAADGGVNYDRPALKRLKERQARAASSTGGNAAEDVGFLDIPAFLRRQAD